MTQQEEIRKRKIIAVQGPGWSSRTRTELV